jgi:hypothetical protein
MLTPFMSAVQLFLYCKDKLKSDTIKEKKQAKYKTLLAWYELRLCRI